VLESQHYKTLDVHKHVCKGWNDFTIGSPSAPDASRVYIQSVHVHFRHFKHVFVDKNVISISLISITAIAIIIIDGCAES
jgi:hypothetical protein